MFIFFSLSPLLSDRWQNEKCTCLETEREEKNRSRWTKSRQPMQRFLMIRHSFDQTAQITLPVAVVAAAAYYLGDVGASSGTLAAVGLVVPAATMAMET